MKEEEEEIFITWHKTLSKSPLQNNKPHLTFVFDTAVSEYKSIYAE